MPTLDWIGKPAVLNYHRLIGYRLLEADERLSTGDDRTGNLVVQGDNLSALKALLPYYGGEVRCIYIDPPYNTGNENWVYNDAVNSPEMKEWLGQVVGADAQDLSRHDKWLCMMYPRLELLKEFLRDDGVILVSIDDNELRHLLPLMDEVFGPTNQIATLVWEKGKKGDSSFFSVTHEYIVVYARNLARLKNRNERWRKRKEGVDEVLAQYDSLRKRHSEDHDRIREEMRAWYRGLDAKDPARKHKHYNWSDARGLYFPDNFHGPDDGRKSRPRYDIIHPVTGEPCKKPRTGWRWEEERTRQALAQDPALIHFGEDHTTIPCRKSYLVERNSEPFPSVFYRDGRAATLEVDRLVHKRAFDFPKDSGVLADVIGLVCGPEDVVLDSFAGSGSTGHAVMKLNARDRGRRRFILVEMEAKIAETVTLPRLRAAQEEIERKHPGTVAGFRFCRLGAPLFNELGDISEDAVRFRDLANHVFFSETGAPRPDPAADDSPLIGVHEGTAIYLLYNGILGDLREDGGNVLTRRILSQLPEHEGARVIYGERCLIDASDLGSLGLTFKQTPYSVRTT